MQPRLAVPPPQRIEAEKPELNARLAVWQPAGTLTLNKLSVDADTVLTLGGHSVEEVLKYSALSAQIDSEEAIDIVLVESYPGKATLWDGLKQTKFVPFNPVDKYTISHVTNTSTGETYRLLKGAPQARAPLHPGGGSWVAGVACCCAPAWRPAPALSMPSGSMPCPAPRWAARKQVVLRG